MHVAVTLFNKIKKFFAKYVGIFKFKKREQKLSKDTCGSHEI